MAKKATAEVGLWLFKVEPDCYSFADLERDGETVWDGVSNNLARQNLGKVRKGDRVLYYHTGKEKAIVGEATVVTGPFVPEGGDPKAVVVKLRPTLRWDKPVTLQQVKVDEGLADWELVRLPRLSVVPVTPIQWNRVERLREGQP